MLIGIDKHQMAATRCCAIWSSAPPLSYVIPLSVPNVRPKNILDTNVITLENGGHWAPTCA
jgi:hypothetical protein